MGRSGRRQALWALGGFLFTAAAGTALHFLWAWTGRGRIMAAFSAVNESTWEHMKILFFPILLVSMAQVIAQDAPNFLAVRGLSALTGTALIPVLYYTYTGACGVNVTWVNLAIFFFSAAAAFALDLHLRRERRFTSGWQQAAGLAALWALALLFILWTYDPPQLPLFQDPRTGLAGIPV